MSNLCRECHDWFSMCSLRTEFLLAVTLAPQNQMDNRERAIIEVASQLKKIGDELDSEGAATLAEMQVVEDFVKATVLAAGAVALGGLLWRWVTT